MAQPFLFLVWYPPKIMAHEGVCRRYNSYRTAGKIRGRKFRDFALKQAFRGINFAICVLVFRVCIPIFRVFKFLRVLFWLWLQAQQQHSRLRAA